MTTHATTYTSSLAALGLLAFPSLSCEPGEGPDHMYQSNYTVGLRILSISNRESPAELAYFDADPDSDAEGFSGAWSNYPFFESGVIAVTSMRGGAFFVKRSN